MNQIRIMLLIVSCFFLAACGETSLTTSTNSTAFKTLADKIEFLERYVSFKRNYTKLEFSIDFVDGSSGFLAAPTEYLILIYAQVPEGEVLSWVSDLNKVSLNDNDVEWIKDIPNIKATNSSAITWHESKSGNKIVGILGADEVFYMIKQE